MVIVTTAAVVFGMGSKAVFVEMEITLAIIAGMLFIFLTSGLYFGVRFRRTRPSLPNVSGVELLDVADPSLLDGVNVLDGFDLGVDGELGCLGVVVGVIVAAVVFLLLLLVVWLAVNLLWVLVPLFAFAVYWVFYMALRRVFVLSRRCRGDLVKSMGYGLLYTLIYTGWMFALLFAVNVIVN